MTRLRWGLAILFVAVTAIPVFAGKPAFLAKQDSNHVRLLCYNINWDSIFPDNDPQNHKYRRHNCRDAFIRVIRAVNPDIACIQEINPDRDVKQMCDIFDRTIPVDPNDDSKLWHAYQGRDNVILARYPLSMTASDTSPPTDRGHAMALIDLPDARFPVDLYVVNAHFKSAGGEENIARRQRHADAIMSWLRDAREPGGKVDLPKGTPFLMCGDFNVYDNDHRRHLFTLETGDLLDEQTFGADFLPDWDNTILGDALPMHNGVGPERWTWRDDSGPFNPGPLDRIIYTDSVLHIAHSFILNTATLSDDELKSSGLQKGDVALDVCKGVFDHLPMVVDFEIRQPKAPVDKP